MNRLLKFGAVFAFMAMALAACGDLGSGSATTGADGSPTSSVGASGETCASDTVDGDLNLYNWSEYIDPALISAFEVQYSVDVVEDFYDSNEAMLAQFHAGAVYDLIVPSDYMVGIMIEQGLLAPLQADALPNWGNLDAQFVDPPYDPTGDYSVAYQWGTTGLGVNLSVVGEDFEPSWALVFDTDLTSGYAGGVSLLNDSRETMGAALSYLGYSLNSTSKTELRQAADVIAAAKASGTVFDSDQYDENLTNGETAVGHGYSGNFLTAFDDTENPDNWAFVIPAEGGTIWIDNMAIPIVSEHPCTAHTFINFLLDPENGAALTNWNFYASPNAASEPFILEEILTNESIYPSAELRERLEIITDTGEFEIEYNDFFQRAKS